MSTETENSNDLVIEPNENNQFVSETHANNSTESAVVEEKTEATIKADEPIVEIKQTSKKKIGILYSIIVVLLIGGGAFYAYTFHRDLLAQYLPFIQTTQTNKVTLQPEETSKDSATDVSSSETNASTEGASASETNVSDEEVADAITESLLQSATQQQRAKTETAENAAIKNGAANSGFKKPLTRPTWVISVSSVAKESIAKARTEELRAAGQSADYYWIPDYVDGGNRYFKVFVGPFATKAEAQSYLSNGGLASDAYVLKVE